MDRRSFLRIVGISTPTWLFPLSLEPLLAADGARVPAADGARVPAADGARVPDAEARRPGPGRTVEGAPPAGLSRCAKCGEWRGRFEPPAGPPKDVGCRCEPSRCSRCGAIVHARRICGHYWSEERRAIIHVPWFVGMRHRCPARRPRDL